jgi:hypothetical protein
MNRIQFALYRERETLDQIAFRLDVPIEVVEREDRLLERARTLKRRAELERAEARWRALLAGRSYR